MFEKFENVSFYICSHCLKITQNVAFVFWHFPPFFVSLKLNCLVSLIDHKLEVFKNSPKWTIFGIFNQLLSTQNVNVARLLAMRLFSVIFKHRVVAKIICQTCLSSFRFILSSQIHRLWRKIFFNLGFLTMKNLILNMMNYRKTMVCPNFYPCTCLGEQEVQ